MERLGLGYETLAALNPRLVYAGLVGYDQAGPYAARPAYDDLIQGGSTLAQLMARSGDGTPRYVPTALADRVVGATAVGAILAALFERERSGRGQRVDVPMFETMVAFVLSDHLGGLTFDPPLDAGGYARQLSPERRPYATRDGYVCALVYTDAQWQRFLLAVGRDELLADARFASFAERSRHIDEVYGELSRIFMTRDTAEWLVLLDAADVPAMRMHDLQSVLDDPQLEASRFFAMVEHPSEGLMRSMRPPPVYSRTPAEPLRLAPRHGEHSRRGAARGRIRRGGDRRARGRRRSAAGGRPRRAPVRRPPMSRPPIQRPPVRTNRPEASEPWTSPSAPNRKQIRDAVAKLCARFDDAYWLERDQDGDFPDDFYRAIADAGWLGIAMPRGIWRRRARHHRGGDDDAGDRRVGRRHVGRLGRAHEHLRPQPGRGVRHRGAEAAACCRR